MTSPLPTLPRSVFNSNLYNRILSTWFFNQSTTSTTSTTVPEAAYSKWFGMLAPPEKAAFDAACASVASEALDALSPTKYPLPTHRSFEVERQEAGKLSYGLREAIWRDDHVPGQKQPERADKARSLVLLLDQFSRNIFRNKQGQALVYSHYDRLARALIHSILSVVEPIPNDKYDVRGLDHALCASDPFWRNWFYMPLMHSEDVHDHELFREKMKAQSEDCGDDEAAQAWISRSAGYGKRHEEILVKFGRYPHRNEVLGRETSEEERKWEEEGGDSFGTK